MRRYLALFLFAVTAFLRAADPPFQTAATFQITEVQRQFWAFQPVRATPSPAVQDLEWATKPLDRFILAKMEANGLRPALPADKRTLLRRVTFDLIGLPPTPSEIDAFLIDESPNAFAKVVDRLLASPHYGEKWGRHWLDVVRYCDSFDARILQGAGQVMDISEAWRYRDWVVNAFNSDLPYDQFIVQQIAGDLVPARPTAAYDGIIATGLLAIGNWGGGDADKEKLLTDIVDDQIDVVGRAFLGLTLACARCHDHKFDPLSQADYYGLAGIFFSTHILPNVGPKTDGPPMLRIPLAPKEQVEKRNQWQTRVTQLEKLLKTPREKPATAGLLSPLSRVALAKLGEELDALKKNEPAAVPMANGAQEGGVPGSPQAGIHDVRIHMRGNYDRLGDLAPRRFPAILAGDKQPPLKDGSGRLQLARWLASPDNPLTARVMVNRLWQNHFGEGIVRTPGNFGKLGERPTHPELLDWLAAEFIRSGWSIKAMHRLILLSATYQQASESPSESLRLDPDNRLFGRMNRRRLEAEEIRDSLLAVAGRLDETMGGPATRDFNSPRRTLYQMTVRSDRSTFRELFDAADSTAIVDKRITSTVAPQALFLLNHPFAVEQAKRLAARIQGEGGDERAKIERLYRLLYGRPPITEELEIGLAALTSGWEGYCQMLLCANEFICAD
jgi:hypothetical protein